MDNNNNSAFKVLADGSNYNNPNWNWQGPQPNVGNPGGGWAYGPQQQPNMGTPGGGWGWGGNQQPDAPGGGGGGGGLGGTLGSIGSMVGKIGSLGSMATPLGIGLSLAGSVIGAVKARKQERKAKEQAKKAKKEMNSQMDAWKNLDTSNPYLNMENTMEDLTINQKQAQMEKEQFQQSQANILDSLRGSAGGGGVAALAQTLAREGQLASQKSAASIGQQERQNLMAERSEAGRIQGLEIQGEREKRAEEKSKTETLLGMAQQEYAAKKEQQAAAKQAKWDAITGGVTGAADMFAGFGQGTPAPTTTES